MSRGEASASTAAIDATLAAKEPVACCSPHGRLGETAETKSLAPGIDGATNAPEQLPFLGRTISGKRATVAAWQREREYMDWCADLPWPARDDQKRDDSWATFMAERRKDTERVRQQERAEQRRLQRHARGLKRAPAGQGPRFRGPSDRPSGRPINPNSKRQQLLAARAKPDTVAAPAKRKVERLLQHDRPMGRPINPSSKRQQLLAARAERGAVAVRAKRTVEGALQHARRQKAERRERQQHERQRDLNVANNGIRRAHYWLPTRCNGYLESVLAEYAEEHHHAAEYHFWRGFVTTTEYHAEKERDGGSRHWYTASAKWYTAKANVALLAAAGAEPDVLAVAEAHTSLTYALALAARAAAAIAKSRRAGRFTADLIKLDQPWTVAAFEFAGVPMPSSAAPALPPLPLLPAPAVPPKLPKQLSKQQPRQPAANDPAAPPPPPTLELVLAQRAYARNLAQTEWDELIDRDPVPPRPSRAILDEDFAREASADSFELYEELLYDSDGVWQPNANYTPGSESESDSSEDYRNVPSIYDIIDGDG